MKTIKSTFLLVLAFLVLALPSTYSFSATTSYENVLSKPFQSTANARHLLQATLLGFTNHRCL